MKTFKPTFLITAVMATIGWVSCTYSRTFTPEIKDNQKAIADSINARYHFEAINVNGRATTGQGGKHTTLLMKFTNGQNLPKGNDKLSPLAKELALQILDCIKDTAQYDRFAIEFGTSKTNDGITKSNYFEFDFTKAELRAK